MTDNPNKQRAVPSVSVTYARNGASTTANTSAGAEQPGSTPAQ